MDEIDLSKTVLFVGDYFSLMTTVVLTESLRNEDEDDDEFAIRLASVLMEEYYGWDVAEKATISIGIVDDFLS
ncbi:MAG: hypothetical protein ACO38Q_04620 [Aquiluna sp.]